MDNHHPRGTASDLETIPRRPQAAPASYLGRSATAWITALQRRTAVVHRDAIWSTRRSPIAREQAA